MMGQILCEKLEWDSNFFEFSIARVIKDTLILSQIEKIDHWCSENHIRCLYFLANACDAQTITLAESHGFHFVDIRMTFDDNVGHIQEIPLIDTNDVVIRPSRLEDLQALKEIAKNIMYLLDNRHVRIRMGEVSRQLFLDHFTSGVYIKRLKKVFLMLITNANNLY